ncbi:hypothetical protein BABA_08446 [Neobacillus bataviensis LMG 21833]|uniref:Cell division protein FtsX n=1 Tax=Neobacillus bataviensis LMG 21833 TaxID=1117379 RepID=K6DB88_9BACI|nr:ABC transporter permease [Neobacillus bataviensis]EKN69807.1 hypothetical protein BABA_08446 [Neobacillus bataviensis LMG 21833]
MNIVNKLTVRHLKHNKRRSLVTIIGVIISVAMVTAVATLGVSFMDLMQRQTIASEGEWHVLYKDVNKEQLKAIKNDGETKKVVLSRDLGYALLEGGQNESKPYLFVKEYNAQGFKQFPIELSSGRLPKASNEVVLSEHIATNAKVEYKIGDQITLEVGQRTMLGVTDHIFEQQDPLQIENEKISESLINKKTASYRVVGVIKRPTWEPTWAPGYTIISYVDESTIRANEPVNVTVVLKKVKSSLYDHAKDLAMKKKITSPQFNNQLLRYYGVTSNDGLQRTLISLMAIIMAVIIIGSVSLIYNAFAISVSERSRHLGMLASVGATKRQKRNSVFFEGIIIGCISIPIGIIAGLLGIGITFWSINSVIQGALGLEEKLTVTVTPLSLLIACAVSMITIFISTYLPAIKASKISAIDAIRQTTEVKLTGKAVKTSKLVRKLFGIEAEIGLKNLKRNKRKYQATVFSLVISIVLFLTVSVFTDNLKKSLELSQDGVNYDISVSNGDELTESKLRMLQSFSSLEGVTESSMVRELTMNTGIDEASLTDELRKEVKQNKSILHNGKYPIYVRLYALNEKNLKAYAKEIGADYKQLTNTAHMTGVVIDTVPYQDMETGKYVEAKAIHMEPGESIDLNYHYVNSEKETFISNMTVAALSDKLPMGITPAAIGGVTVIVSEQAMDQMLTEKLRPAVQMNLYLKSNDPMKTQQEMEEIKEGNLYIHNVYQNRQQDEQMIMLMSVFTYGFIALITAISIANIFNTISTSISLRKREFAMLKSVGMTPKGFNKMINYESMFYGIKALLYGLPISIAVMYLIHRSMMNSFRYGFTLPWISIIYVVAAVFIIVGSAMIYSSSKVKKENIVDTLKQDSI